MKSHDYIGRKIQFTAEEWNALTSNVHLDELMTWTEKVLKHTSTLVSPQFFHPSFTERQKDIIVSLIYFCYGVQEIERVGKDGICIVRNELSNPKKQIV